MSDTSRESGGRGDPRPEVSPHVLRILQTLEDAGYETWCVGGAIRDALLGNAQQDVDLATAALPADVQRLFRRTVPVGIEHGTVGIVDDDGVLHEVTTFRRDVQTDGRHAIVAFGVSLDDDLARRDFTINAIAYHPLRHRWHDPFGGRDDLRAGIVRAVGDPAARFREDRLRIIRAFRFAARFGFAIDSATWVAIVAQSGDTAHLSAERVRTEWVKGLVTAVDLPAFVAYWLDSGVGAVWLPECAPMLRLPTGVGRDAVLLTALTAAPTLPLWARLKGSNADLRRAEAIDRGPAAPSSADPLAVRRWLRLVGEAAEDLVTLATWRAGTAPSWAVTLAGVRARAEATTRSGLAIGGRDLIAAGVPAGPAVGALLDRLLDAVIEDPECNTRDTLLALAQAAS